VVAEWVDWSEKENDSVVLAYLDMLGRKLRDEPYVKTETNRRVQEATGRSKGSVEFKFANVSAVLNEMHHPYIRGYQPRSNFQDSLRDAVLRRVHEAPDLAESALHVVTDPQPPRAGVDWRFVDVPDLTLSEDYIHHRRAAKRDYVAIDAANRSLGLAGEFAVVSLERQRLRACGCDDLAASVEHVSETRGDGLGFDVLSYTATGAHRFIEVKTTRLGIGWPIIISRNEVALSKEEPEHFVLYRVFDFDQARPGLYALAGDVTRSCALIAESYRAVPHRRSA
jgi:hypothetical protein